MFSLAEFQNRKWCALCFIENILEQIVYLSSTCLYWVVSENSRCTPTQLRLVAGWGPVLVLCDWLRYLVYLPCEDKMLTTINIYLSNITNHEKYFICLSSQFIIIIITKDTLKVSISLCFIFLDFLKTSFYLNPLNKA